MKLTKSKLKGIVKECLLEILSEGVGAQSINEVVSKKPRRSASKEPPGKITSSSIVENKNFSKKVKDTVSSLTEDSIMQEILADTARTTLQEQSQRGSSSALVDSDQSSAGIDLGDIFGPSEQNWSSLAFAEKKNGLNNN